MTSSKSAVIMLGAGPNIGQTLARTFASAGHKVALVSRSGPGEGFDKNRLLRIRANLTKPKIVRSIFATVKQKLGVPNVVVYNAGRATPPLDASNLLTVDPAALEADMHLMNTTPYIAAREAVVGFESLDRNLSTAYIYTGNWLSAVTKPRPLLTTLAMGKGATSVCIGMAAEVFRDKGYRLVYRGLYPEEKTLGKKIQILTKRARFNYADERTPEGSGTTKGITPSAHAEICLQLAEGTAKGPKNILHL
jgi:NAD(P)-dependent dehydrogenase (short-subunit alcohol dehydrogenase family)